MTGSNAIKSGSKHEQAEFYLMFSHLFLTSFVDIILNLLTGHEGRIEGRFEITSHFFFFCKTLLKKKIL